MKPNFTPGSNRRYPSLVLAGFSLLLMLLPATAHIEEGQGNALQLFSYRLTGTKPVINGNILSRTSGSLGDQTHPNEWAEAYSREIMLTNGKPLNIFLMNDDDSLYVAILKADGNNGDGTGAFLYFDQGVGGGEHDGALTGSSGTTRNEPGYGIVKSGTVVTRDLSWNGTGWVQDADGQIDFNGAGTLTIGATKIQSFEFAIPLRSNKAFDGGNADLNITSLTQEIGFFLRIAFGGGDPDAYWAATNGNPDDPTAGAGWADIRLNVNRKFTTFYATYAANGNPTLDGNLEEDAWRGAYRRDIVLSNFDGSMLPATLLALQDHGSKDVYLGLIVEDPVANAGDYVQIYFEEKAGDNATARDYILEAGAEDALRVTGTVTQDRHWGGTSWIVDTEAADNHGGMGVHSSGRHTYEFRVPYQAGAQDIGVTDNGLPGFLLRYHDADQSGLKDYFWEYTVNADTVRVDKQSNVFGTAGWAHFQFGAPYTQVIFPQDGAQVEGVVHTRVYAVDEEGVGGVTSVVYFRAADTATQVSLTKITGSDEWGGTWNAGSLPNGTDTLVFRATDNDGISVDRLVVLQIANGGVVGTPPSIALTSPTPGSILSGDTTLNFTAAGGSGTVERTYIVVDGADTVRTTTGSTHLFSTVNLVDGSHTVQFQVYNSNGVLAMTPVITYLIDNRPSVRITAPTAGDTIGGNLFLQYVSSPARTGVILKDSLFVDGKAFAELTAGQENVLDISRLTAGIHSLKIKAIATGNHSSFSEEISVFVLNGPSAAWNSDFADSSVSGPVVLRFTVASVSPATVASVELSLDGGDFRTTSTDTSDSLDTRPLSDGAHSAQLRVTDNRGKVFLSPLLHFTVKNSPSIIFLSPNVDALATDTLEISFQATAVSPDTIQSTFISVGGGDWIPTTTSSTHKLATKRYRDGDLRLQLRAVDGSGKSDTSLTREIVVDNSPPLLSFPQLRFARGQGARQNAKALLTAQAIDLLAGMHKDSAVTLASSSISETVPLSLRDDGEGADAMAGDNIFSAYVDVTADSSGVFSFSLRARDAMGNDTILESRLALDNLPPETSLRVEPEPDGGTLEGIVYVARVVLKGSYSDSTGSGLASAVIKVENDSGKQVNNSPISLPLSEGSLAEHRFSRLIYLVPGKNIVTLSVSDLAGNVSEKSALLEYRIPKVTVLATSRGAAVVSPDGSAVRIPPDALQHTREISIHATDPSMQIKPLQPGLRLMGVPREFGPDGTQFRQPVTLTLTYTDADLDPDQDGRSDFDLDKLTIVFWNGHSWVVAGDAIRDPAAKTVSVMVNHFTLFDIAEDTRPGVTELTTYWTANPIKGKSEFVFRVPKPGKVSLHVLDMAGDLVRELIHADTRVDGAGSVQWDGSHVGGRFAGAGLYIYVFKYTSNDGAISKLIRKPVGLVRD